MRRFWVRALAVASAAAAPVMSIAAANADRVQGSDVFVPAAIAFAAGVVIAFACRAALRGNERALAVAAITIVAGVSYGAVYDVVDRVTPLLSRHAAFLSVYAGVVLLIAWLATRPRVVGRVASAGTIACGLVLLFIGIEAGAARMRADARAAVVELQGDRIGVADARVGRPNVYFIVLDGYASARVLRDVFGFDNRPFLMELGRRGFVVSTAARSNYANTLLSLTATLNVRPIPTDSGHGNLRPLFRALRQNRVMRAFRDAGYRVINISSGDITTSSFPRAHENRACGGISEVAWTALRATVARPFVSDMPASREHVLCSFRSLVAPTRRNTSTFTFAHVLAPHPPYRLAADCGPTSVATRSWNDRPAYLAQIRCLNVLTLAAVDDILRRDSGAVVVIEADHGPASQLDEHNAWDHPTAEMIDERMGIIAAAVAPDTALARRLVSVTPVNLFAELLPAVTGTRVARHADDSFFSEPGTIDLRRVGAAP